MDTRMDVLLAIAVSGEKTEMKRDSVRLENSGGALRSLQTLLRSWVSTMERVFETPLEQATFCTYHPAECSGIA
jgi:hypothetical protein